MFILSLLKKCVHLSLEKEFEGAASVILQLTSFEIAELAAASFESSFTYSFVERAHSYPQLQN